MFTNKKRNYNFFYFIFCFILITCIGYLIIGFKTKIVINNDYYRKYFKAEDTFLSTFLKAKNLLKTHQEIIKISFKPDVFLRSIYLDITVSGPVSKICFDKNCLILDDYGRLLLLNVNKKLFHIQSKLPVLANSYLDQRLIKLFFYIFSYSNWKPKPITSAIIHENFDVSIFDEKREFLFDANADLDEQIKKFHQILNNYRLENVKRVDLRIPGKVFIMK